VKVDLAIDDAITDIVAKGFDAGIRSGGIVDQDMIAVPLTPDLRMAVVAAPAFAADVPTPEQPTDLQRLPCITYRWLNSGVLHPWRFEGLDSPVEIVVDSVLTVNATDLLLSAALDGIGFAFLLESLATPFLADGRLVRVLEEWCRPFPGFHFYFPGRRHMPAALRAFVDFMKIP
jgi:DNA-binding transcriptional LysR family regulator